MVIQKTKNSSLIILKYLHNHKLYLSKSIIKSCINKPVEHNNQVLSSNFEFSVSEDEEERKMKRLPTRSLTYWGILAVAAANKDQEDCQEDGIHLQRLAWYVTVHEYHASIPISTGATAPPSLNIHHEGHASRGGRSPVNKSYAGIQAWSNLNVWQPCTTITKEVDTNLQQESSSPWNSRRRLCAQKSTIFSTRLQGQVDA